MAKKEKVEKKVEKKEEAKVDSTFGSPPPILPEEKIEKGA